MTTTKNSTTPIPLCRWTNGGDRVYLLKCVNADMTSHSGFIWPTSGPVKPAVWKRDNQCDSGGLFGWPWGIGIGIGKEPIYNGKWIVFAAWPDNVIEIEYGKCKAIPGDDGVLPEIVFCGDFTGAMNFTQAGRIAYTFNAASGAASNSGARGAASNSGDRGAASNSGYSGAASNSGDRGIAATTGEYSTIKTGPTGLGAATANRFYWICETGAVVVQRWMDDKKVSHVKVFKALKIHDGKTLEICDGKIIKVS